MSKVDLNQIQAELKVAIQNHQFLVGKIKNDPGNATLCKQLHDLQSKITELSEKQKALIQLLRLELLSKQTLRTPVQPQVSRLPPPQFTATNLSTRGLTLPQPLPAHNNPPPAKSPQPAHTGHVLNRPPVLVAAKPMLAAASPTPRTSPPLIRVPTYSAQRPSGQQQAQTKKEVNVGSVLRPVVPQGDNQVTKTMPPSAGPRNQLTDQAEHETKKSLTSEKKHSVNMERRKIDYMAALDLVTPEALKDIQSKRSERKRRSTANPQFSYGHYDLHGKRAAYLHHTNLSTGPRKRGRPPKNPSPAKVAVAAAHPRRLPAFAGRPATLVSPAGEPPDPAESSEQRGSPTVAAVPGIDADVPAMSADTSNSVDLHEEYCAMCHRSGELLMCDTCSLVYHLQCLEPPLAAVPQGLWSCPKCHELAKSTNTWPGTIALVHTYMAHKAVKEDERKKLEKRVSDLNSEKGLLESRAKHLTDTITEQLKSKGKLVSNNTSAQQSVDKLKAFIKFFQSP